MERGANPGKAAGGPARRIRLWLGAIGLGLMLVLILQNQEPIDTQLLFWKITMPRFLMLSMVGGLGLLAGYLLGRFGGRED